MYYHVRVLSLDKPALYNAIRESFSTPFCGPWRIPIGSYTDYNTADKFILTRQQRDQLRNSEHAFGVAVMVILIHPEQLMLYVNNCMDRPKLDRILAGENP